MFSCLLVVYLWVTMCYISSIYGKANDKNKIRARGTKHRQGKWKQTNLVDVVLYFDAFAKFQLIRHILSIDFNAACGGEQEQILCDDGQKKGEKLVFICCLIVL
ncbi:hypothetical protein MtrunA17_Chr3g0102891 [Medicago truncatula]|uniref:Transmembrane protein n=1 Tax=Medicago truncatula TaxID=3880 RepID=A0A396ISV0_MEDTR|nr:hypothetical protein MtrunA17_Chr3g0102891 [Medicago truncatula]